MCRRYRSVMKIYADLPLVDTLENAIAAAPVPLALGITKADDRLKQPVF